MAFISRLTNTCCKWMRSPINQEGRPPARCVLRSSADNLALNQYQHLPMMSLMQAPHSQRAVSSGIGTLLITSLARSPSLIIRSPRPCLGPVRGRTIVPFKTGVAIRDDGRDRLVGFMSDRRSQFPRAVARAICAIPYVPCARHPPPALFREVIAVRLPRPQNTVFRKTVRPRCEHSESFVDEYSEFRSYLLPQATTCAKDSSREWRSSGDTH